MYHPCYSGSNIIRRFAHACIHIKQVYDICNMAQARRHDDIELNLQAAGAFMMLEGGATRMIANGTHLDDLTTRIVHPDPSLDLTSLYQLQDIARLNEERRAARLGSPIVSDVDPANDEPFITPEVARHWLTVQTKRARELPDGSLEFQNLSNSDIPATPDHLGYAAMRIAMGDEPQLFTEAYAEATDHESPIADFLLKEYARDMVKRYATE